MLYKAVNKTNLRFNMTYDLIDQFIHSNQNKNKLSLVMELKKDSFKQSKTSILSLNDLIRCVRNE